MPKRKVTNEQPAFSHSVESPGQKSSLKKDLLKIAAKTAGATALATALFNGAGGKSPLNIVKDPTPSVTSSSEVTELIPDDSLRDGKITLKSEQNTEFQRQEFAPDFIALSFEKKHEKVILGYTEKLVQLLESDPTAEVSIVIHGLASDESSVDSKNHDANLGESSVHNTDLASARGRLVEESLNDFLSEYEDLRGRISVSTTPGEEVVLNESELGTVSMIASNRGMSVEQLIAQYNNGKNSLDLSESDQKALETMFDANRGAVMETTIKRTVMGTDGNPCDIYLRQTIVKKEHVTPGDPGWRIDIVPFFIPPFPFSLRRNKKQSKSELKQDDNSNSKNEAASLSDEIVQTEDHLLVPSKEAKYLPDIDLSSEIVTPDGSLDWKKISALVAAGAVLVFPWFHKSSEGGDVKDAELTCTSIEVTADTHTKSSIFFPILERAAKVFGHELDTHILKIEGGRPESVHGKIKPHTVFVFDEHGQLLRAVEKPEEVVGYIPIDNPSNRYS